MKLKPRFKDRTPAQDEIVIRLEEKLDEQQRTLNEARSLVLELKEQHDRTESE